MNNHPFLYRVEFFDNEYKCWHHYEEFDNYKEALEYLKIERDIAPSTPVRLTKTHIICTHNLAKKEMMT